MNCPRCESENVQVQVINEVHLKNQHYGCLWWLLIGIWWVPLKWLVFTPIAIIIKIFGHKGQRAFNRSKSMCVCQDCGYSWRA